MEYGLQLYSIRDITGENLEDALRQVAEIGYKFVEFAGFFGHTAGEVTEMLEKHGLRVSGTHSDWRDLVKDFDGTLAYHKAIGNRNFIVPGTDLWTRRTMDDFINHANELQPKLAAEGITFGFHNHSREFLTTEEGYIPFLELVEKTDLKLELDTYWAYAAGEDPVELMEKYKERIHFIHIKDGDAKGNGRPLGMGTAPVKAVYEKALELNFPMVVESETLDPSGIAEAKICFEYLKKLEEA
ncbi:MAG: sugar phosphate isomerase/epimerase family protein [Caldicoprobacterales bacterium]|jgi:sugar phosphate isomerase/epimerase|nr:sugar phosphate isomerase/epimerase [Clostridiales bacterium]